MSYDCKRGYMDHTEAGIFWFGNDGFNGELIGTYTDEEAADVFKMAMNDAHSVFNPVAEA